MPPSEAPLQGRRILITRPAGRADALRAALAAAGAEVTHLPLLTITPLSETADAAACARLRQLILELDRYQRVIAASVNAVEQGFEWIVRYWPQLPVGIRWYGIGAATAAALAAEGVAVAAAPTASMTSEALLAEPDFAALAGERVLILRGIGGRGLLAETLTARGARVDFAECYHRGPPALDASAQAELSSSAFDAVSLNSGETLAHFAAATAVRSVPIVVPSQRVADAARELGFGYVATAANAGDDATVAALIDILQPGASTTA